MGIRGCPEPYTPTTIEPHATNGSMKKRVEQQARMTHQVIDTWKLFPAESLLGRGFHLVIISLPAAHRDAHLLLQIALCKGLCRCSLAHTCIASCPPKLRRRINVNGLVRIRIIKNVLNMYVTMTKINQTLMRMHLHNTTAITCLI